MTGTDGTFSNHVTLSRNDAMHRYELHVDAALACLADYRDLPGHTEFVHTETEPAQRGRGLAEVLARYALDDVVAAGKRIVPHCSFIAHFVGKHPEYTQHTDWPEPPNARS
jgi:predicted GNAT family acetyltransferase